MGTTVITAEGLGKSYIIGHKPQEGYATLRDVMANTARHWWSRLRNPHYHTHEEIEEFWALKNVNFEIKQGDRVGIIGRNGAGKSTLLKILSRITEPTTGKAKINGRVASLLEVGTGFHPELTGCENIFLNGAILGMSRAEIRKKFDEIVDFAEVEKFLDTPVKRYSSGMYVRLAFAVAAHLEPEILIVDEVLAVGDAQFQKKCLGKMGEVSKEGRTVLFVSHNMAAIEQLCSRGITLQNGHKIFEGNTIQAINKYLAEDHSRNQKIINHIDQQDNDIKIFTISINGKESDFLSLSPTTRHLHFHIEGEISNNKDLCIAFRLYNEQSSCLAFYTGQQYIDAISISKNKKFILEETVKLPHINQGLYYISLYIQNHQNRNQTPIVEIPYALEIDALGHPTETGWTYKYNKGNGFTLLKKKA